MKRYLIFVYGLLAYALGAGVYFLGLGGFLANLFGPLSIDQGREAPFFLALVINIALIILFGLPHSVMARPRFKKWWTRVIPPAAERSTFMLQAGLFGFLLIWQWRAMPGTIWHLEQPVLRGLIWGLFLLGWLVAFWATIAIDHFELTGLKQVYAYLRDRRMKAVRFQTPWLYRLVRHPMQFGFLLVSWAAPEMTHGRLVFALGMTTYILIGLYFEERDLVQNFGDRYRAYQQQTPKLLPWPRPEPSTDYLPGKLEPNQSADLPQGLQGEPQ